MMIGLVAGASLSVAALWTASDPFVGNWRLDVSRSVIVDQMVVEAAGPSTFTFRFEGAPAETIPADGADHPGLPGTTLSVRADAAGRLKVIRKQGGRVVVSAAWTLSRDGRTLHDAFTAIQPDGSAATTDYVYRRMKAGAGFAGVWESTTPPTGLKYALQIRAYDGKGLTFDIPGSTKSVIFDGRDHPVAGAAPGVTATGRRRSARALTYTETSAGKVLDTRALTLSADGKTLTMNLRRAGQATPDVLVFGRD